MVESNVSSVDPSVGKKYLFSKFLSDKGPTLETLDFTICIGNQHRGEMYVRASELITST